MQARVSEEVLSKSPLMAQVMKPSPAELFREGASDTSEAERSCYILGRGIDAFNLSEGVTMDQALLKGRVLSLSETKVPIDLGEGRHVSLPRNTKSMPGRLTTVHNKKTLRKQDGGVHDASALLNGQFHFASLEGGGSYGSSQFNVKSYTTLDEHGFHTDYHLFIAPEFDDSGIYLIPEVEEQIPADGNPKDMAAFLRKFTTHAVTGIEVGRWHDATYTFDQGGSDAFSNASGGAGVGAQAPTGDGLQLAIHSGRSSEAAAEQLDEHFVSHQSGGGRQIMMTTFTALSELVRDPIKQRVLEDAIAEVARAPRSAAPGWELQTYLDFCKAKDTWWVVPPRQERGAAVLAIKKQCPFGIRDRSLYINTKQVLLHPGTGAPTGICLCLEQENEVSVSLQQTKTLPWFFKHRGFETSVGEWRDATGKAHKKTLHDHFTVDCRQVLPRALSPGETGVLTGAQLVYEDGVLTLRCHFSPLRGSNPRDTVWRGCKGVSHAASESSSSASVHVSPSKPPSPEATFHSHIDTTEYTYGFDEEHSMMHWVLVGARLDVDGSKKKGKLSVRGKFALLTFT